MGKKMKRKREKKERKSENILSYLLQDTGIDWPTLGGTEVGRGKRNRGSG